jgi:hypothetical protein
MKATSKLWMKILRPFSHLTLGMNKMAIKYVLRRRRRGE